MQTFYCLFNITKLYLLTQIEKITSKPETVQDTRRCVEILSDLVCRKICSKPFANNDIRAGNLSTIMESTTSLMTDADGTIDGELIKSVDIHLNALRVSLPIVFILFD